MAALALLLPACAAYKPARVLAPEAYGLTCVTKTLCLEDPGRRDEAAALVEEATVFVRSTLGPFRNPPRVLFCTTTDCFAQFGNPLFSGQNTGTYGVVINATGWKKHILRHELIHHFQNERFGILPASVLLPRWYIEGMAYSMSEDPGAPLPGPQTDAWRSRFDDWIAAGNRWDVPPPSDTP